MNKGSPTGTRTTKDVIDQAMWENRVPEFLLYGIAISLVVAGGWVLYWGVNANRWEIGVLGVVVKLAFIPAMYKAYSIRRDNIRIRLLEIPLANATTATEAARALKDAFVESTRPRDKKVAPEGGGHVQDPKL